MTSQCRIARVEPGAIGFGGRGDRPHERRGASEDSRSRGRRPRSSASSAPEFRNRLDAIVTFKPLSPRVMETIVEKFILQLEAQLAERRIAFTLDPEARAWLATKGYDPVFGARPLARVIQTRSPRPADRRNPLRAARTRRHRDDRHDGDKLTFDIAPGAGTGAGHGASIGPFA